MHETMRRLACRISFVLVCVIPTLLVLGWIAQRSWPGQARAVAAELSARLGLRVQLQTVAWPRPGVTLLEGIELADPETGAPLARMRMLEMARGETGLVLLVSQAEIQVRHLDRLVGLIDDQLLRGAGDEAEEIQLAAGEVTLHGSGGSQTLTDVGGRLEQLPGGPQATLGFRVAGIEMSQPAQLRAIRNRQLDPPATRWEMHTGGAALPCSFLAEIVPPLAVLGPDCRLRGTGSLSSGERGWEAELACHLLAVDLDHLVSQRFPHKLSGRAEILVSQARFRGGRVEEAAGWISAGPGVVSHRLLASAGQWLELAGPEKPAEAAAEEADTLLPYRQLALGFFIDAQGLKLVGQCAGSEPGTAIVGATGPLATTDSQPRPVVSLVRTLVPHSEVQVPATRESDLLLRVLPLPEVEAAAPTTAVKPTGHLRFGGASEQR